MTAAPTRRNDFPTWWRNAVVYQIYPQLRGRQR